MRVRASEAGDSNFEGCSLKMSWMLSVFYSCLGYE